MEAPTDLTALLGAVVQQLEQLPPGGVCLLPGGWKGTLSVGWVMHVVERSADGRSFACTTANLGPVRTLPSLSLGAPRFLPYLLSSFSSGRSLRAIFNM